MVCGTFKINKLSIQNGRITFRELIPDQAAESVNVIEITVGAKLGHSKLVLFSFAAKVLTFLKEVYTDHTRNVSAA